MKRGRNVNELALFAGGGGSILAGKLLGWRTVCAVEIDSYARSILLARQRDGILEPFPVWDDVTTFDGKPWSGSVDVITAGFPCQDISICGRGEGITGSRSGLWKEAGRIIGEVLPRFILLENSTMLTRRGLGVVLGDLADIGFNAEWGVFSAAACGAAHRRERIYILAYADGEQLEGLDIQKFTGADPKESRRRQFARAVGAALSEDDYAAMPRNTHELAEGMDRLRVTGNGWVPTVAARAFRTLASRIAA